MPFSHRVSYDLMESGVPQDVMKIKKKIGIKYCGGCNPTYERVEMIRQIQSRGGRTRVSSF